LKAIDVHAHPSTRPWYESMRPYLEALESYYKSPFHVRTDEEMAEEFLRAGVGAMILAWDAETTTGLPSTTNDYVASIRDRFPGAVIGAWASVDPWKGEEAVRELDRAVRTLRLAGVKFQGVAQAFFPNDRRFYPLWETCASLNVPVMFHTGTTGVGAGVPGGNSLYLKYGNPMPALDDLAADFPGLTIIGAHPSWPWQEEMLAIAMHKTNVYLDLSGWSPKYFSPILVQYAKTLLQDRVLFGTDYPFLTPEQWLAEFDKLGFKPEVRQKILLENCRRLLRL